MEYQLLPVMFKTKSDYYNLQPSSVCTCQMLSAWNDFGQCGVPSVDDEGGHQADDDGKQNAGGCQARCQVART